MAMARPMGRPSGPPIALICTVILLVIAIVVAVALYLQMAKSDKDAADQREAKAEVARQLDVARKAFAGAAALANPNASPDVSISAVDQLRQELGSRLEEIPNHDMNPSEKAAFLNAVAHAKELHGKPAGSNLSKEESSMLDLLLTASCFSQKGDLIGALRSAAEQRQKNYDALLAAKKDADDAKKAAADADAARVAAEAKATQVANDEAKKRADLEEAHKKELAAKDTAVADKARDIDTAQKNYETLRIESTNKVAEKDGTIAKKDLEIRDLNKTLRDLNKVGTVQTSFRDATAKMPDGGVAQVFAEMNMVNLRLRNPSQAKLGMRYVIFSKDKPIPDNLQGKAVVEVSSVDSGSIQAKIIKTTPGDPIITGDLALNLVVGPVKFNFVVFGDFDLTGEGMPAPNGKSQIETLVKNWGGNIQQNVDITTNFVILGEKPLVPAQKPDPATSAPLVVENYDRKVAANEKWTKLHDWAAAHTIPIMNTQTFLTGIGYYNYDHAPGWEKRVRPNDDYFVP